MYRDLVLPVKQALLEVSRGFTLLTQALGSSKHQHLETLVHRLAAVPHFPGAAIDSVAVVLA